LSVGTRGALKVSVSENYQDAPYHNEVWRFFVLNSTYLYKGVPLSNGKKEIHLHHYGHPIISLWGDLSSPTVSFTSIN
jgi:hypothetical protein